MKYVFLTLLVFWGLGIIFMVSFFSIIRKSYKPEASVAKNTVLKILPVVSYQSSNWQISQVPEISQKYQGVIFTHSLSTDWLSLQQLQEIASFNREIKKISPGFKIYLELTPGSTLLYGAEYDQLLAHKDWFLNETLMDIRNPLYRQHFFSFFEKILVASQVDGIYLTGLDNANFTWWELSMKDFVAQIRQYYSDKTILFHSLPLNTNTENFNNQILTQLNGMVMTDFSSVYGNQARFGEYYNYLTTLASNPDYLDKQFVYTIVADESLQRFFQSSYLLLATDKSWYYFTPASNTLYYSPDWLTLYQDSLTPAIIRPDGVYQRLLTNAIVLVNPTNAQKSVKLDQDILQSLAARIYNDQPIGYLDTLNMAINGATIINLIQSSVKPTPTVELAKNADWSDHNSSVYSDFVDIYSERNKNSVVLGESVSLEELARGFDTFDDSLKIDGLEGGIFSLNREQIYDFTVSLANFDSSGYQLSVWADWDGKNNNKPVEIYKIASREMAAHTFKVLVPDYSSQNIFFRIMATNDNNVQLDPNTSFKSGEIEDYFLNVN